MKSFIHASWRWLAAGAILAFGSSFGQTFFISIFAGEIQNEFDLSHGEWGLLYAIGTLSSAIIMLWAGVLTDVVKAKYLGPISLSCLALACLFMATNPVVWLLPVVIFFLRFFGQGMLSHISAVSISRWFNKNRGKALALATFGYSFGEALLPMVFVTLLTFVFWKHLWFLAAGMALLLIFPLITLLKEERSPSEQAEQSTSLGLNAKHWNRKDVVKSPLFWLAIPALIGPSAFGTTFFFMQAHFAEIKGITHLALVALFPIYTATVIFALMAWGFLLDKLGAIRLVWIYQLPSAIAFVLFSISTGPVGVAVGMIFMGITSGGYATLINAFWAEAFGTKHLGGIKSIGTALMVLGSSLGPGVIGFFMDLGNPLSTQYLWVSLFYVISSGLFYIGIIYGRRTYSV